MTGVLRFSDATKRVSAFLAVFLSLSIFSVIPLHAQSVLNFPRLSSDSSVFTGIAIVNPNDADASVTLTAYGADGIPLKGNGVSNPVTITVPGGQQYSKLTLELFGASLPASSAAWFQATSVSSDLTGFFLVLNPTVTFMDGADVPIADQRIIFNNVRIDSGYASELNIINPGSDDAHLLVQLAGTPLPPAPQSLTIPAHGAARLDAATFFSVTDILPGAYVIVDSDVNVAGMEIVSSPSGDIFALNARKGAEQLGSLYFLQLSVLGSLSTQLDLVNYSADPVVLTISAYKPDGSLYGPTFLKNNPVTRALNGKASLREDVQTMFGFSGDKPLDGWILVKSTSDSVNGFVTFADSSTGAVAAVTSFAEGRTRALFSHIATTSGFSTAISLLNPGAIAANVRLLAIDKSGIVLGVFDTVLQPSQRFLRYLGTSDLIYSASGLSGGIVFIKSDQPIYMSSLIRSANSWVNIPPQPAPDTYNPGSTISTLKMSPPIAIVPPGASQRFSVSGSSSGLVWKVNGTEGGSPSTGTISNGLFAAPSIVPARQIVTITAEGTSQAAGASADVLDKVPFTSGLGVIQSVAYLDTLGKVYSAELAALSAAPSIGYAAATGNSQIYEVPPAGGKISVSQFPGEVIPKIIPFKADNGTQFLLLAAQTSGRIIRLNPVTKEVKYVVTGLNQPASIVIDPVSGDLYIVEQDKISTVASSILQADLSAPGIAPVGALASGPPPFPSLVIPATGGAGIAINRCTGYVYFSLASLGTIVEYHPASGDSLTIASGLNNPGQMLGIYRENVTCPASFQLLIAERGANRITLLIPSTGTLVPWLDAPGITDVAFIPTTSSSAPNLGILLADYTVDIGGIVYLVPLSNLYENKPPNPPVTSQVEPRVNLAVTQTYQLTPPTPYQTLAYTVTVTNTGPASASGVSLTDTLPSEATYLSVSPSQGNCGQTAARINCSLGKIPVNGKVTLVVKVAPYVFTDSQTRTLRNTVAVSSIEVDTDLTNNVNSLDAVVTSSVATALDLTGLPSSVVAATPASFTVVVKDQWGNFAAGAFAMVSFSSTDPAAILPSTYVYQQADGGSHVFTVYFRTPGTQSITVSGVDILASPASQSTVVSPGAAASVTLTPSTATPTAGIPLNATVSVNDATGNPMVGYSGTVRFASSQVSAVLPANYTFLPSENGVHVFPGAITLYQALSSTITVTDTSNPSITVTSTLAVGPNVATALAVATAPLSPTAGATATVTVTARDAYGNVATGYAGTVTITASPTYLGTPPETIIPAAPTGGGIFTFTSTLYLAGSRTVSALGSGATPISGGAGITVSPAATSRFAFAGIPAAATSGTAFTGVTLTALDVFNNTTTFSGTATLTSSDVQGAIFAPATAVFTSGTSASLSVTLKTVGSQTVTVTGAAVSSTSSPVAVSAGPLDHLGLTPATSTVAAGSSQFYSARAFDFYNNDLGDVTISTSFAISPNGSCFPGSIPSCSSTVAGTHTVTGTYNTRTGTASLTVTPLSVSRLTLTGVPGTVVAGAPFSATVTAEDTYGNVATGYMDTVHFLFEVLDTGAVVPADYTFTAADAGVRTFTGFVLTQVQAASGQILTVQDVPNINLTASQGINVAPAGAASFNVSVFCTGCVSSTLTFFQVTARDPFGNVATGYLGTVAFTSSPAGSAVFTLPGALPSYTFLSGDNGIHTFASPYGVTFAPGLITVTATDTVTGSITGSTTLTVF